MAHLARLFLVASDTFGSPEAEIEGVQSENNLSTDISMAKL